MSASQIIGRVVYEHDGRVLIEYVSPNTLNIHCYSLSGTAACACVAGLLHSGAVINQVRQSLNCASKREAFEEALCTVLDAVGWASDATNLNGMADVPPRGDAWYEAPWEACT